MTVGKKPVADMPDIKGNDLTTWLSEFVEVSQRAWSYVAERDFVNLAKALEQRDTLIRDFARFGDLGKMSSAAQKEVATAMESVRKIDREIERAIRHEMDQDNRAIRNTATLSRALSAYDRLLPEQRRFDTQK